MPDVAVILGPVLVLVYSVLLLRALWRMLGPHQTRVSGAGWLVTLSVLGLAAEVARLLPGSLSVTVYLYSAALIVIGVLTFVVLNRAGMRWWLAGGSLWWLGMLGADLLDGELLLGALDWTAYAFAGFPPEPVGLLAIGWLVGGGVLVMLTVVSLYTAHLPEVANRALFWLMVVAAVLLGVLLAGSGTVLLAEVGHIALLAGVISAMQAVTTLRLVDVRRLLLIAASLSTTILLSTVVVALALGLVATQASVGRITLPVVVGIAFVVVLIIVPVRQVGVWLTSRAAAPGVSMARGLRQYSQQVTAAIELEHVAQLAQTTVVTVLEVRSSAVLLAASRDDGAIELEGVAGAKQVVLQAGSPVKARLFDQQAPLLQFDLEFGPAFDALASAEQQALGSLRMSAYAPIAVDGRVIAVLVGGPKVNDEPYTSSDLELLAAIANQTGIALRNARLLADLRRLNEELASANQDLARLNTIKTDFITIASHELRTPLAQVRGYTDIIESVVGQDPTDQEDVASLLVNLRRASGRMEVLISNMLDVSRLDVDALDLHYATVTMDAVIRLALEPLTDAIRMRQLGLTARGLRDLPPLEADLQRLVQAFQNLLGNAVKYTPDGGEIEVQGGLDEDDDGAACIHMTIRDSGIGIAAENQELVFEKFFRIGDPGLHSTGETKFMGAGPGLGLTIARGVIEGHGGRIWMESAGHDPVQLPGVTVHVVLPLVPPDDAQLDTPFEITRASISDADRTRLQAASDAPRDTTPSDGPRVDPPTD